MKLSQLKNKLEKTLKEKNRLNIRPIRKEYQNYQKVQSIHFNEQFSLDKIKIIGITGSTGKSTTAFLVHEYLKSLGYKSVLYSSAMVDSPASHIMKNEAFEVAVSSEESLLSIMEEAESYGAEYLVLEVNESTLEKGILQDVPFTVRALTNINPYHNEEQYTKEEYVALKKSFFKNIDEDCKCVIGLQDNFIELFEEFLTLNTCETYTFSSQYIARVNGLDSSKMTCLLQELYPSLDGMDMVVRVKDKSYSFNSSITMRYNALNLICAMTILEALGKFDATKFNKCIKNIQIPGRVEVYKANGRVIVVDTHLPRMLEFLQELKLKGDIYNIKVVIGSMGSGFKDWDEKFKTPLFLSKRTKSRQYACDLLKQYVDFVYLTEDDNAKESALDICQELQGYLEEKVPSIIVVDREQAIRQAIEESKVGDVIFISGRGNRRILCNTSTTMKLIKDSEVVEEVVRELGWR